MEIKEIWMDVVDYEGIYQVSNIGRIKRLKGSGCRKERALKLSKSTPGYLVTYYSNKGMRVRASSHREVAKAFLPNPHNKSQVNHKDGNTLNNVVSNLEWVTPSENTQHAYDSGLYKLRGERSVFAKLKETDVLMIRASELTQTKLAEKYGVSQHTISRILRRTKWMRI